MPVDAAGDAMFVHAIQGMMPNKVSLGSDFAGQPNAHAVAPLNRLLQDGTLHSSHLEADSRVRNLPMSVRFKWNSKRP
jgi:hypothetical protein